MTDTKRSSDTKRSLSDVLRQLREAIEDVLAPRGDPREGLIPIPIDSRDELRRR